MVLIKAPQDKAFEEGLAEGRRRARAARLVEEERQRKARLAEEREYGFAKGYSDGYAKGFSEGRAEALARVRAEDWHRRAKSWYRRYKDAQERGEPFDEVPPEPPTTQ